MQLTEHRWAINTSVGMPELARHSFFICCDSCGREWAANLIEQDGSRSSAAKRVVQSKFAIQPNAFQLRQIAVRASKERIKESLSPCTEWSNKRKAGIH